MTLRQTTVSVSSCDSEPIHLLGAIQPVGFLLVLNADWMISRASLNVQAFLGVAHDEIVGSPAETFLSHALLHDLRGRLQLTAQMSVVERLFNQPLQPGGKAFDIAVHLSGREFIVEFEPATGPTEPALSVLRRMSAAVQRQGSSAALYNEAVRQVRGLTGFDRVMLYRFDEDGTGEVVAETALGTLEPFLGLRYPASDIPAQARELYKRNLIRFIVDVDAASVPVGPALSPEGQPLDLSMSVLRSVSPIHIEYLRNMSVRSSMSISILQDGELWGLFACHHGAPLHASSETRSTAELFGQTFSHLLEARQRAEDAAHDVHCQTIHHRIAAAFADQGEGLTRIPEFLAGITDHIPADGIGAYCAGEVSLVGTTPSREEFLQLVKFLNKTAAHRVFATHRLAEAFPPAADYLMRAAGLLSIPISRSPRDYLVYFRREAETAVTWAGDPRKPEAFGPNGPRLTPRKSFEAWRETVRGQSRRWLRRETRAAEALRLTLVELVLRMSAATQAERVTLHQRQEILIAELNHRVRNILGLVRGLVTQSAATASDVRAFVDTVDQRIRSLARAHDLLTLSNWTSASLHSLIEAEIEAYGEAHDRIDFVGPDVLLQPRAFTPMALVAHELVTNARKHGALRSPHGRIALETSDDEVGNVTVCWRETGGPPVSFPSRRGFGSTILEQAIPFEVNGLSVARFPVTGFCLDVTLPADVAACAVRPDSSGAAGTAAPPSSDATARSAGLLSVSLLVEDNLFIAIDAEDMLHGLGAETVIVAKSVAEGLKAVGSQPFTFALLDVNLGAESSLPIARALQDAGIPFVFATGYGEQLVMPKSLADVPIVPKPYNRSVLMAAVATLLASHDQAAISNE